MAVLCPFCRDTPTVPSTYALCSQCDVVYCKECLEDWTNKYASMCPVCKIRTKFTRSKKVIGDGRARLSELKSRAPPEVVAPRIAPGSGELAQAAVNPEWLEKRREEDDEAASLELARQLGDEGVRRDEPDAATMALIEQMQRENDEQLRLKQEREEADAELARRLHEQEKPPKKKRPAPAAFPPPTTRRRVR